ncbi:MAG: DNA polymerase III subunit delta' [Proteobacteria bacterium]|nr:DNA polymerase III subunit delta' [Pseudomonadota bacterium]MBU1583778.1 DNA polymerase III subunit delta' [Pseudomonadota bacterium]MBU2455774.1 DNA polymerase III subunit delta' [Pseudomonadota bacterium]MBU2629600.1 DNA polymerase III subunit delta' [Pseudomonadota bacterium]
MSIDQTMSDFDQLQYQAKAVTELTHIIQTNKIPNALLFSGNENTGKKEAAFFFAKGCNCLSDRQIACGNCKACRKIAAQSHPDILCINIEKGKKIISISQIREMGLAISSRPNEAKFRMVLILNSDLMNNQAQNALLKLLEEPPEKTFFILTATSISLLLPTIISRCRKIRFRPLTDALIKERLINKFMVDGQQAHIAAKTADSDLKKALIYLNLDDETKDVDWIKKRQWLLDTLASIITTDTNKSISKGLMLSQQLSCDPDHIDNAFSIMTTFFRDLMIFKLHPKKIVNLDFFDTFTDINQVVPSHKFFDWVKELYETQKRIASNSTLRLTLDRFFLKIRV